MKRFACLIILALSLISCSQDSNTHEGEIYMGNILSVQLLEDLNSPDVEAVIKLNDSADIPDYTKAELYINDILIAQFNKGQTGYYPKEFGDIPCLVRFTTATGVQVFSDTLKLYIETGYIQYNSDGINGDIRHADDGEEIILTPSNVSLGSNDKIWAYDIRVPKDGKISFDYITTKLTDNTPNFGNNLLQLHFRLDDYADRDLLYPGEPYPAKYIDAEVDKWIDAPLELTHGVYTVYVCPNFKTDRNRVSVIHNSEFSSGMFTANYESIRKWPND